MGMEEQLKLLEEMEQKVLMPVGKAGLQELLNDSVEVVRHIAELRKKAAQDSLQPALMSK